MESLIIKNGSNQSSGLRSLRTRKLFFILFISSSLILFYISRRISLRELNFYNAWEKGNQVFIQEEDYILEYISELQKNSSNQDAGQDSWQKVSDTNDEMFVYSAFYDVNFRSIRIITIANRLLKQTLECRFGDEETILIGITQATLSIIRENKGLTFSSAFILCPIIGISSSSKLPKYVSIGSTRSGATSNILQIHYPFWPSSITNPIKSKFSICVQPIYDYDDVIRFLEWIEFHRAFGVDQFTFYNVSIGPKISCAIEAYNKGGLEDDLEDISIEVLQWGDPPGSSKIISDQTIKLQNQLGALNDCIYRQRGKAGYVLNIDLDEFIIPRINGDRNYLDLISRLDVLVGSKNIGLYEFRNVMFSSTWINSNISNSNSDISNSKEEDKQMDSLQKKISLEMMTLQLTLRMAEPYSDDYRTKYICIPERMVEAGIHHKWEMYGDDVGTLNVPPNIGLLYHYRFWNMNLSKTEDFIAQDFSNENRIPQKIYQFIKRFNQNCNFIDY